MNRLLISIYLVFACLRSYSQKQNIFDTTEVIRIANYYVLLQENSLQLDSKTLTELMLHKNISWKILKSKGFKELAFFSITTKAKIDTIIITNGSVKTQKVIASFYNGSYIFGYNTTNNTLYKLVGFKENDFTELYKSLKDFKSDELQDSDLKKRKKFLEKFGIEGVDLNCLYSSIKYSKNKCNNSEPTSIYK